MMDVKNGRNHDTKTEPAVAVNPLEMLAFSVSHDASDSKTGAPGAAAAAGSPEAGSGHAYTRQEVGVVIGIIASALLLTYGNILMEMLFNLLGI